MASVLAVSRGQITVRAVLVTNPTVPYAIVNQSVALNVVLRVDAVTSGASWSVTVQASGGNANLSSLGPAQFVINGVPQVVAASGQSPATLGVLAGTGLGSLVQAQQVVRGSGQAAQGTFYVTVPIRVAVPAGTRPGAYDNLLVLTGVLGP